MNREVIVLIPPSEGKQPGGNKPPLRKVSKENQPLIDHLNKIAPADWSKWLGVKGKVLEQAVQANRTILTAKTLAAIERYTGVVYSAIDYVSLSPKGKDFFNRHVRIVSALFGLVKPDQLIPDYKWPMEKGGFDKHWRSIITQKLKDAYVIDLLPQAHKKAVQYEHGISVDFCLMKDGKNKPAGHSGKHIKGRFVRFLCENQIVSEKEFPRFKESGFKYSGNRFIKQM
ncbi:MAG: YaaA family protein [Candidatus Omnitrophota bacterium]